MGHAARRSVSGGVSSTPTVRGDGPTGGFTGPKVCASPYPRVCPNWRVGAGGGPGPRIAQGGPLHEGPEVAGATRVGLRPRHRGANRRCGAHHRIRAVWIGPAGVWGLWSIDGRGPPHPWPRADGDRGGGGVAPLRPGDQVVVPFALSCQDRPRRASGLHSPCATTQGPRARGWAPPWPATASSLDRCLGHRPSTWWSPSPTPDPGAGEQGEERAFSVRFGAGKPHRGMSEHRGEHPVGPGGRGRPPLGDPAGASTGRPRPLEGPTCSGGRR